MLKPNHHSSLLLVACFALINVIGISMINSANVIKSANELHASPDSGFSSLARFKRDSASDKENTKPGSSSTKAFEAECLRQHNKWRRLHKASPLKIDPKLVKFAKERANHIAKSDGAEFKHPDNLEYGENLAWHSDSSTNCSKLIKMWYDEVKLYSYKEAAFSHEAGHFTQLVWRDTRKVGCARDFSQGPRGGVYLVCNYDPAGNWKGEFKENVKPAKKGKKAKQPKKDKKKKANLSENPSTSASGNNSTSSTPSPAPNTPQSSTTSRRVITTPVANTRAVTAPITTTNRS